MDKTACEVTRLWFENNRIYVETAGGEILWQSLLYYKRLYNADDEQRRDYELNIYGIHWESIDEDVSYESFRYPNPEPVGVSKAFLEHPELNASAVARRLGMAQSLLAAYITGTKRPSARREKLILDEIHRIGAELQQL